MGWYGGYGWHAAGHGGPWFFFALIWLALIAVAAFLVVRYALPRAHRGSRARDLLDERYARGELSSEEYRERVDNLG